MKQLPKVLCLHLKRFKYVEDLQRWVAAATSVQYHAILVTCMPVSLCSHVIVMCIQHEQHAAAASVAFPYVDNMAIVQAAETDVPRCVPF